MFKKKEKKGTLILTDEHTNENINKNHDQQTNAINENIHNNISKTDENNVNQLNKLHDKSKKISKKKRGIEAFPKIFDTEANRSNGSIKRDMHGLIDKEFLKQSAGVEAKDKNLEKFIEEKLRKDSGLLSLPSLPKNTATMIPNDQNAKLPSTSINKILSELQKEIKPLITMSELNNKIKDAMNNQTTWISGLVEVPLPIEQKIKSIEETEQAKRKKLIHQLVLKETNTDPKNSAADKEMRKAMKDFTRKFKQTGRIYAKEKWKKKFQNISYEGINQDVALKEK